MSRMHPLIEELGRAADGKPHDQINNPHGKPFICELTEATGVPPRGRGWFVSSMCGPCVIAYHALANRWPDDKVRPPKGTPPGVTVRDHMNETIRKVGWPLPLVPEAPDA